jgi:hypothetical protein
MCGPRGLLPPRPWPAFRIRERRNIGIESELCLTCSGSTAAQAWCGTTLRFMRLESCGRAKDAVLQLLQSGTSQAAVEK